VPVYSTFRGKTGAVDVYLAKEGRLKLLESVEDVGTKLKLVRRNMSCYALPSEQRTLRTIVDNISGVVGSEVH
jgi:hypothetical protein